MDRERPARFAKGRLAFWRFWTLLVSTTLALSAAPYLLKAGFSVGQGPRFDRWHRTERNAENNQQAEIDQLLADLRAGTIAPEEVDERRAAIWQRYAAATSGLGEPPSFEIYRNHRIVMAAKWSASAARWTVALLVLAWIPIRCVAGSLRGRLHARGHRWVGIHDAIQLAYLLGPGAWTIPPADEIGVIPGVSPDVDGLATYWRTRDDHRAGKI